MKSLALKTNLIIHQFESEITQDNGYTIIKTPSRPNYFWGNYLITENKIKTQDNLDQIIKVYRSHFPNNKRYITIAFDNTYGDIGIESIIKDNGFKIYQNKVLSANEVNQPKYFNDQLNINKIDIENEINQLIEVHTDENWYLPKHEEKPFLISKFKALLPLHNKGLGERFGVYINNKLVADLGIYRDGDTVRFNDVATHSNYRNQGLCSNLVYHASKYALENWGAKVLVMEADENYHAARIYESVGFKQTELFRAIEYLSD